MISVKKKIKIINELLGSYYKSKDEYLFKCPFCAHHKKKLSVNLEKNVYKCWVCDMKGNVGMLVKKAGNQSLYHRWCALNEQVADTDLEKHFNGQKEVDNVKVSLPKEYICLASNTAAFYNRRPLNYLKKRGISKNDIFVWKIGYCEEGKFKDRIIIPSFDVDGNCNYFVARSYTSHFLAYKNPPVSKSNIVFNELLINWNDPVVLVEGVFDSIKTDNSIPLLGSSLSHTSKLFQTLVEHTKKVVIALDADALKKSLQIIKNLLEYNIEVYQADTTMVEDLGSVSKEKTSEIIRNSKHISFDDLIQVGL